MWWRTSVVFSRRFRFGIREEEKVTEMWVTEFQTPALGFQCKIKDVLRNVQTDYQHLVVVDTEQFGRMLLLDGMVMTTDRDEYVYHEMIAHVGLNAHAAPKHVLIIGGGDGGALREVLKHPAVERATLVDIDGGVIQASRDFFPQFSPAFDHPKAEVLVDDGISYIKAAKNAFDLILIDSTEPVGPAVQLFSAEFYRDVYAALKHDGMMIAQSESPFFNQDVIALVTAGISSVFPICKLYLAAVPTYPSGLWSFTAGSKRYDPEQLQSPPGYATQYYNAGVHRAAFQLPTFVAAMVKQQHV
jgi:spermidine synthase